MADAGTPISTVRPVTTVSSPSGPATPTCATLTNDQQVVRERLILEDFFQYLRTSFIGDGSTSQIANGAVRDALLGTNVDPIADLLHVHGTANRNKLKTMSGLRQALDAKITADSAMQAAYTDLASKLTVAQNNSDLLTVIASLSSLSLDDTQKSIVRERLILEDFFQYLRIAFIGNAPIASSAVKNALLGLDTGPIATLLGVTGAANINKLKTMSGLRQALDARINASDPMKTSYSTLATGLNYPQGNLDLISLLSSMNPCEAFSPVISGGNPMSVTQGDQQIAVTLTGNNLPDDPAVEVLLNGNADPSVTIVAGSVARQSDGSVQFKINVAADALFDDAATAGVIENPRSFRVSSAAYSQYAAVLVDALKVDKKAAPLPPLHPNCSDGIDNDHDGKIDSADEDCNPAHPNPNGESTPPAVTPLSDWQRMSILVHDTYKLSAELGGGYGGFVPSYDSPIQLRAAAERPNLTLRVGLGSPENPVSAYGPNSAASVFGPQSSIWANTAHPWLEVLAYFQGAYEGFYHLGHDQTNRGNIALGATARFIALNNYRLFFDLYGKFQFDGANYQYANRAYPTGIDYGPTGGVAVGSSFGTNWVLGRAFGEYSHYWFDWNRETLSQPFSGETQQARTGVELTMNFSKLAADPTAGAGRWIPDLRLTGAAIPWGRVDVPNFWPVAPRDSYENVRGGDATLSLRFPNLPWQPQLIGGYQRLDQEGWKPSQGYSVGIDVTPPKAGEFRATWSQAENVTRFYGGDVESARLRWTMPREWADGRLEAISIQPGWYNFDGHNAVEGFVLFDISKLIWPIVPQSARDAALQH